MTRSELRAVRKYSGTTSRARHGYNTVWTTAFLLKHPAPRPCKSISTLSSVSLSSNHRLPSRVAVGAASPTSSASPRTSRYRGGALGDYASRLHYFVDWIGDNEARGRIENLTTSLGGTPVQKDFYLITRRELPKAAIDQEAIDAVTETLLATEQRLSSTSHDVLGRESAPEALRALEDGDLVAFVRERPGLLVHHAGFVYWANGTPRLLHASSYHERVVITESDLTDYLLRRPERKGVIIARPLAAQDVPGH